MKCLLKKADGALRTSLRSRYAHAIATLVVILLTCRSLPAQTTKKSAPPSKAATAPAATVPVATAPSEKLTREQVLEADLQEAIDMLAKKKYLILLYDFLPPGPAMQVMQVQDLARTRGPDQRPQWSLPPESAALLLGQLKAANEGQKTFNRTKTLVQIDYIIKPAEQVPPKPPQDLPTMATKPQGDVSGLGSELADVLVAAVKLLEEDQIEKFVRAMYPIPELARLTNYDETQKLLLRFSSNPDMKAAIIRDLSAMQAMTPERNGNVATFTMPPLINGDSERIVKLELVGKDWRFFDSAAEKRPLYQQLIQTPVSGYTIPGSAGVLMLKWYAEEESWKLVTVPAIVPVQ